MTEPEGTAPLLPPTAVALAMIALASWGLIVVTDVLVPMTALVMPEASVAELGSEEAVAVAEELSATTTEEARLSVAELESEESVAVAVLESMLDTLESEEPDDEETEPVRARELMSSGMVSMNAMVGPATTLFVSWSRMLFARGCELLVMYSATGPLTPWGTTHAV